MEGLKQLPYNMEAEQSVLGALLLDPNSINEIIGSLKIEHFYVAEHRHIYEAIIDMFTEGRAIDVVILLEKLKEKGVYDDAGGKEYLIRLSEVVPTARNIANYAKIVTDKAILRSLIEASDDISKNCYEQADETRNIIDYAEQKIYGVTNNLERKDLVPLKTAVGESLVLLNKLNSEDADEFLGIPTYISDIDKILGGMNKGDLVVLAARPGIGKTSLALNVARNVAMKTGKTVAIFSLEMSNVQLAQRLLSSEALVDGNHLRDGKLSDSDWEKISEAAGMLSKCNILLDDTSNITVSEIKAKLRRIKNLGFVVIDYLQLMQSGRRSENRVLEIADITRNLKIMAKEFGIPILVLSQLSRSSEKEGSKREPILADLRESGAIEQDADSVLFLYHKTGDEESENVNTCEAKIAKNRHGAVGNVTLQWIPEYTRFTSMEKRYD